MVEQDLPIKNKKIKTLVQLKNVILILLIIIDLLFIISITFFTISLDDLEFMADFDLFVCIILGLNLIGMYHFSDETPSQFLKSHVIDIISIIPFNFIFFRYLAVFRIFRILQFFQVIRIFNIKEINVNSIKYFIQNQLLKVISLILLIYIIVSSIILFNVDESFFSIFDSIWYTIVTVSGVGYGDITPTTYVGKAIGMLTIILGVFFISIFTAAMAGLYAEKTELKTRNKIKKELNILKEENNELKEQLQNMERKIDKIDKKLDDL